MQSLRQYREIGRRVKQQYEDRTNLAQPSNRGDSEGIEGDKSHHLGVLPSLAFSPETDLEKNNVALSQHAPGSSDKHADDGSSGGADNSSIQNTEKSETAIGRILTGIGVRRPTTQEGLQGHDVFIVELQGENDPLDPHQWSYKRRIWITANVTCIGWIVGFSSAVDSGVLDQAAREFGVSEITESLATALFLIALGCGALVSGPFSEEFGRNPVYIATMLLFMIFVMASALAPNFGAQLVFRFIAGFFSATPLTCAGGTISDIFDPAQRSYAFPIFAMSAFSGPVFGPVVGGFIGEAAEKGNISWRWTEWVTLIIAGVILVSITFTQPETYAPVLLKWKAEHLRRVTGDRRYVAAVEIRDDGFMQRVLGALYRPFAILFQEPIVIFWGIYISIVYIVLFGFLNSYTFIYEKTYGTSHGLTGLAFIGIAIGLFCCLGVVPLIGRWYRRAEHQAKESGAPGDLPPEARLWFSMIGAPAVPLSLFWMGWTARPDVSIWSPLASSVVFGFGILSIFISCYQYLIDSYEQYAASALASITLLRYVASGAIVIVAIPMYERLGVSWTLTLMGALSAIMVPAPYLLYWYGRKIRSWSKFAAP